MANAPISFETKEAPFPIPSEVGAWRWILIRHRKQTIPLPLGLNYYFGLEINGH